MYKEALNILKILNKNGFTSYIIGGYPRDKYLGTISNDIDICTSAKPDDIVKLFSNVNTKYSRYGNTIIKVYNYEFEVTTFRKDIKYIDRRNVIIEYVDTLEEDLKRRDFIMNTLCIDYNGNYIDIMGSRDDINNKIIRLIGDEYKLIDDPLRMLRAIRFSVILNFEIEKSLKEKIKKYGYLIDKLSDFRKKQEMNKIKGFNKERGLNIIKELNLDQYLISYMI